MAAALVTVVAFGAAAPAPEVTMPPGWIAVNTPSERAIYCVDTGTIPTDWRVTLDSNRLQVAKLTELDSDPLPFKLTHPAAGLRHVLKVDDGWLIGFDDGEWGGSLWWFNADGTQSRELEKAQGGPPPAWHAGNVQALLRLGSVILAFTGIEHLTLDEGLLYLVERGPDGAWAATSVADLGAMPEAVVPVSGDAALVVTNKGLLSVSGSGHVQSLHDVHTAGLYANSIATADGSVVFVGMREYVIVLTKTGSTYAEQWYSPGANTCSTAATASPTP